MLKSRNTN